MSEFFSSLNLDYKSFIIPIITFIVGWIAKILYERYTLNYKLKIEYDFEQKKRLKEEIAKNKMHLINISEEFNHRLWNFNENISKDWHQINQKDWEERTKYYTRSFVYRFLVFIHWVLKTEKDTISIDTIVADKKDIEYLKFIKTFKDIFSEPKLLKELDYSSGNNTNHFFKNNLKGYSKWVIENEKVIDFDEFSDKTEKKYVELEKVIDYFSKIENNDFDKNLNILRCFHLLIISFLNEYGHTYQHTSDDKINKLTKLYKDKIKIKEGFKKFIEKSKLEKELKKILKKIK